MKIGDVARAANVSTSTIRYYESIGLLPEPQRESGRRVYEASIIEQLRFIQLAKSAGWRLDEIQLMREAQTGEGHVSAQCRKMAAQKLAELDEQIMHAQQMQALILQGITCECQSAETCELI